VSGSKPAGADDAPFDRYRIPASTGLTKGGSFEVGWIFGDLLVGASRFFPLSLSLSFSEIDAVVLRCNKGKGSMYVRRRCHGPYRSLAFSRKSYLD
jgi:hypothetical protein